MCRLHKEFQWDTTQKKEILSENIEAHDLTLQKYIDQYH